MLSRFARFGSLRTNLGRSKFAGAFNSATSTNRSYASTQRVKQDNTYPPHEVFPMPALSPTMESGSISSWSLSEGESFVAGQALCSIETDKANVDFEAQDEGVLGKILHPAGPAEIACGTPICVAVEDVEDVSAFADFTVDTPPATPDPQPAAAAVPTSTPTPSSDFPSLLFPSARHLAESNGLDATVLQGSGKGGRVTKGDVQTAMHAGTLPPLPVVAALPSATTATSANSHANLEQPSSQLSSVPVGEVVPLEIQSDGQFEDLPNNKMRKIIAKRLTESKATVPHVYVTAAIPLDAVLALRKELAKVDIKVSVNDFIIRCSALALRDVPQVNSSYDEKSNTVRPNDSIDVSVAVATPTGLITPIVFASDSLGLAEITTTVRNLATKARDGKLAPHEYQGGTFSVSNLGMFGIDEFSAVINPPQAAILAVGGGTPTAVPAPFDADNRQDNLSPQIQTIMTARLSADRRVVDEATASLFMSTLSRYMTQPDLLLL